MEVNHCKGYRQEHLWLQRDMVNAVPITIFLDSFLLGLYELFVVDFFLGKLRQIGLDESSLGMLRSLQIEFIGSLLERRSFREDIQYV